jgi:hypothetical protein
MGFGNSRLILSTTQHGEAWIKWSMQRGLTDIPDIGVTIPAIRVKWLSTKYRLLDTGGLRKESAG